MNELLIEAKPENLDFVLDFVNEKLEAADCPMKVQTQIAIAVEEVFVNIAHYAYNPVVGGAKIRVSVDDEIVIEFEDNGNPYNPLEKEDPDITASAEEREIGGLGIFMVKNIMDAVDYCRKGNKNILTIKKKLI
jgi:anti-sigma regulatory factor (Ser/Thr protein kinase)